ncbi:MAG: outer membrane lipid asymmetry maintenance protein MlaD [Thermodesulfovibrionales bacterium]|nr:outer membrane lipid asymmetry maintenance protein MlaD [Thermodesulfovibrionales bacterium]
MRKINLELAVGFFVLIGIFCLGYLSIKLGRLEVFSEKRYIVHAKFEKAGGIKPGAVIEIAGVEVGKVKRVMLDKDYQASISLLIEKDVEIQEDAIASIKTKGLIGEKYILITPGGSDKTIPDGGVLRETESAVDLEEIIGKFVFGGV